jgi:hypothetical protein
MASWDLASRSRAALKHAAGEFGKGRYMLAFTPPNGLFCGAIPPEM